MAERFWALHVRKLHWAIATTVTFQQFSSLWMSEPGTQFLFSYHRILGGGVFAVVVLFWIFSHVYGELPLLFPWGKPARREVGRELLALARGRLPAVGPVVGLAGFIHGLGVLALSGCALTGMIMFSMIPPGHSGPPDDAIAFTRYTLLHKWFGQALWVYWWGHVGLAVIHQVAGANVFGAIFRLNHTPRHGEAACGADGPGPEGRVE